MEKKVGKMLRQKSFARNWGEPGEFENLDGQIMDDSFERWVRSIFSCSENVHLFFSNFEGPVFHGNKSDKGILNFRLLMCKATDMPLRGVLNKRLGICTVAFHAQKVMVNGPIILIIMIKQY